MTLSITYEQIEAEIMQKERARQFAEGYAESYAERQQQVACKMLQAGMEPETIALFTGLAIADLPTLPN